MFLSRFISFDGFLRTSHFQGFVSDPGLSTFVVQTEENDLETLLPPLITACAAAAAPVPALVPGAPVLGYFSDGWYRGLVRSVPKPGHAEVCCRLVFVYRISSTQF